MNFARPLGSAEIEKSAEVEVGGDIQELPSGTRTAQARANDAEISVDNLTGLLRQVSERATREIENLVGELQALRKKLDSDRDRIQRGIDQHAALSQQVMQLTNIISESVKKLPPVSNNSQY
jgi:DNA anti-recombination protein RmuC